MQMQGYALVAAGGAHGDGEIGELVRAGWMRLWGTVRLALGADVDQTATFLAHGMLFNTLTGIGIPSACRETRV